MKKRELHQILENRICNHKPDKIIFVAIDGVDNSGKTTLADELKRLILKRPIVRQFSLKTDNSLIFVISTLPLGFIYGLVAYATKSAKKWSASLTLRQTSFTCGTSMRNPVQI